MLMLSQIALNTPSVAMKSTSPLMLVVKPELDVACEMKSSTNDGPVSVSFSTGICHRMALWSTSSKLRPPSVKWSNVINAIVSGNSDKKA